MSISLTATAVCDTSVDLGPSLCGYRGRMAWVVDGCAPGILSEDEASRSADMVVAVNGALGDIAEHDSGQQSFADEPSVAVQVAIDLALERWRGVHGTDHLLPQISLAAAHMGDDVMRCFVLGDCAVLMRTPTTDVACADTGHDSGFTSEALGAVAEEIREGGSAGQVYADLRTLRRDVYLSGSEGGGTWSPQGALFAGARGVVGEHPVEGTLNSLLLANSGMLRLDRELAPWSGARLLDAAVAVGVNETLTLLRSLEERDPECAELPRFGKHTAASAVLVHGHLVGV